MTNERIAEIKALCEAATFAKWSYGEAGHSGGEEYYEIVSGNIAVAKSKREVDAEFIAASRQIIPELLEALENREEKNV